MQLTFIKQHSDDGDMLINISTIHAIKLSKDGHNADVLISDGSWIRVAVTKSKLEAMVR